MLEVLYRFCSLMQAPVRTEPSHLDHSSDKRPDIQVALAEGTLLGDVTIIHPSAKTSRKLAAKKGVEAVGDLSDARKMGKYAQIAANIDMEFLPIVLYTYGGFHKSALRFIDRLTESLDTATCLMSRADFKQELKKHIAIAVQRGTADIMIQDHQRQQQAHWGQHSIPRLTRSPSELAVGPAAASA